MDVPLYLISQYLARDQEIVEFSWGPAIYYCLFFVEETE